MYTDSIHIDETSGDLIIDQSFDFEKDKMINVSYTCSDTGNELDSQMSCSSIISIQNSNDCGPWIMQKDKPLSKFRETYREIKEPIKKVRTSGFKL